MLADKIQMVCVKHRLMHRAVYIYVNFDMDMDDLQINNIIVIRKMLRHFHSILRFYKTNIKCFETDACRYVGWLVGWLPIV